MLRLWAAATLAALGMLAGGAPAARAYVFGGLRWPGHTITYFDGGPNHAAVKAAVHAWNTSGANLRFVPVTRSRARVVILPLPPAGCYLNPVGFATLGYFSGGDTVHLRACPDQDEDAITAAHELGHILGLNHETRRCATMNPSAGAQCGTPPNFDVNCRILQADDVRGAIARYGGHLRPIRSPEFCPTYSRPPAPLSMTVAGSSPPAIQLSATVRVAAAERRLVVVPGFPRPTLTVSIYEYRNSCPAGAPRGNPIGVEGVPASGRVKVALDYRTNLAPGTWCFAAWTTDDIGRRSGAATTAMAVVAHVGPTAGFQGPSELEAGADAQFLDASAPGDDGMTRWSWNFGDGATSPDENPDHVYAQPGSYTVTLTVTASDGQRSTTSQPLLVDPAPPPGGNSGF